MYRLWLKLKNLQLNFFFSNPVKTETLLTRKIVRSQTIPSYREFIVVKTLDW